MLESMRFCHDTFLKICFIQDFTSTKFVFISKYQFIELANRVNVYINYLYLCIDYLYKRNLYDYFYKFYVRNYFQKQQQQQQ